MEDLQQIYERLRSLDPVVTLNRIRQAQTEEERNFWSYIHDMNLQHLQKAAIEQETY